MQVFCWDANDKGTEVHLQGAPSHAEAMYNNFKGLIVNRRRCGIALFPILGCVPVIFGHRNPFVTVDGQLVAFRGMRFTSALVNQKRLAVSVAFAFCALVKEPSIFPSEVHSERVQWI